MPGMSAMPSGEMLQIRPWTLLDFVTMFLKWAIMMVGMMVPTATFRLSYRGHSVSYSIPVSQASLPENPCRWSDHSLTASIPIC